MSALLTGVKAAPANQMTQTEINEKYICSFKVFYSFIADSLVILVLLHLKYIE